MAKAFSLETDSRNMEGALRQLAQLTGAKLSDVVEFETMRALERAASLQKAARVKEKKAYYSMKRWGLYKSNYVTKRPSKAEVTEDGRKLYYLFNFYPDQLWNEIQNATSKDYETALKARGLLKKAWYQLAKDLGMTIKVPAYVQKATTPKGDYPENVYGMKATRGNLFYVEGVNARPYAMADRRRVLGVALRGRVSYMKKNLRMGVFDNAKKIAKEYPGLVIR